ncbi:MAG: hypothetical protein AAF603_09785, partial [Pseudomonadota bacterium]
VKVSRDIKRDNATELSRQQNKNTSFATRIIQRISTKKSLVASSQNGKRRLSTVKEVLNVLSRFR